MTNNLSFIRECSRVSKKFMSKLLNVSVYTYTGYETGRLIIPKEVLIMIERAYSIAVYDIFCPNKNISKHCVDVLKQLSSCSEQEREKVLIKNLTGDYCCNLTYKNISVIKNKLRSKIYEKEAHKYDMHPKS